MGDILKFVAILFLICLFGIFVIPLLWLLIKEIIFFFGTLAIGGAVLEVLFIIGCILFIIWCFSS